MTERTYTERDLVLAKRTAYRHGAETWAGKTSSSYGDFIDAVHSSAARQYPLPKITRPRVILDRSGAGDCEWRCINNVLQWRRPDGDEWRQASPESSGMFIYAERVKILADLLANPNETVEE